MRGFVRINAFLVVATVAMAAGTLYLAKATQDLVKDTTTRRMALKRAAPTMATSVGPACPVAVSPPTRCDCNCTLWPTTSPTSSAP